jgi:hypothetical protein
MTRAPGADLGKTIVIIMQVIYARAVIGITKTAEEAR